MPRAVVDPAAPSQRPIDQMTIQVIGNALATIAEQMGVSLIRTAYSLTINERADCSTAIFDTEGNVIAQAPRIPLHLGSMLGLVGETLKRQTNLKPGDMFVANDPYAGGGTHLQDITILAPVFWDQELFGFVANIAHHTDVGGMIAGSETPLAEEIIQEGLRLSPVRIAVDGRPLQDIIDIIALNSRVPEERVGDLWAQLSANLVGIRALEELIRRYGSRTVRRASMELLDHAERRIRSHISAVPDGAYESVQWLDDDGIGGEPVEIRLGLTVKADSIRFDFSGTAPQLKTSRNVPPGATLAVVYGVLKSYLDPTLPPNSGYFRAVDVHLPEGSLLNPAAPAAVGQRAYTCQVISDVLVLALNQAAPHLALAGSGPFLGATISGLDTRVGGYFLDHESWAGALGARRGQDGMDGVRVHHSNAANLPIEVLEAAYPLRVERYELIEDSGGLGQWRGGLGQRRDMLILAPEVDVSLFGERRKFGAAGVLGGKDGRTGRFIRNPGNETDGTLSTADILRFKVSRGEVLRVETPGGGGCGDPKDRPRDAVIDDVIARKVSPASAVSDYGLGESEALDLAQLRERAR